MPVAQLISPQALNERQAHPGLVILDCRFALEDPDYGHSSYVEGHIAGAQYADLERHLSGPVIKGVTGRHPLPEPSVLLEQLRAWGINQDSDVVLYDDGPVRLRPVRGGCWRGWASAMACLFSMAG